MNAERRAAYRRDGELRTRIRVASAAWRLAHPEARRVQKCREALRRPEPVPCGRGKGHRCASAPRCTTILHGRVKKCRACKLADLRAAEAALAALRERRPERERVA